MDLAIFVNNSFKQILVHSSDMMASKIPFKEFFYITTSYLSDCKILSK